MSDYYTTPTPASPLTVVRSGQFNTNNSAIDTGFAKLPTEDDVKRIQYGTDTSASAALYEVTVPYLPGAYREGLEVTFKAIFENTGAANISVNGGTNEPILDGTGAALVAGSIKAGQTISVIREPGASGTGFQLLSTVLLQSDIQDAVDAAAAAEASAAAALVSENNAATSETNAAGSASAASTSETNAATSETNAGNSETAAGISETNAGNSETAAGISETNAAASETAAGISETNAAQSAVDASLAAVAVITGTSTTSVTIGTGAKVWTIELGKEFATGMSVKIVDDAAPTTNFMTGTITAYNSGNGQLDVLVSNATGSGTKTAWTITIIDQLDPILPYGETNKTDTSLVIDFSAGNDQYKAPTGDGSFSFTGAFATGTSFVSVTIDNDPGAHTLDFSTNVDVWFGGVPTIGTEVREFVFWSPDAGTTVYGAYGLVAA